ncbi:GTP-binding protein [Candidatus Lokiarchaeum ossiferum]
MVYLANGRYYIPENLSYSKNHHVYLDLNKKLIGLDQIGFAFLASPQIVTILVENEIKINEPFASIVTEKGITTLNSPCSGKIKTINTKALEYMEVDTYTKGFLLEFEEITEIREDLISGDTIGPWAKKEVQSLLHNHYSFKIVEIGDSAVGKTAIKVRFTDNYFKKDLKTTLGVDFGSKEITCEYLSDDDVFINGSRTFKATLNVWDAAGQAHYEKIRGIYYRDAKGALLCYDVNNPISFKNLQVWVDELEEHLGLRVPTLLIGNKTDLERKVPLEEARRYAKQNGFLYVECSAKTGRGVNEAFKQLAVELYKKEEEIDI